jgi:hypothetical protein
MKNQGSTRNVLLFRVAADNIGRCFDLSHHVKDGKQPIWRREHFDLATVNFDAGRSSREAWFALYGFLLEM